MTICYTSEDLEKSGEKEFLELFFMLWDAVLMRNVYNSYIFWLANPTSLHH